MSELRYMVQSSEQFEYNTDPQRRCYWGAHASSEWRWSEWRDLDEHKTPQAAEESVISWRRLNGDLPNRKLRYRVDPTPRVWEPM